MQDAEERNSSVDRRIAEAASTVKVGLTSIHGWVCHFFAMQWVLSWAILGRLGRQMRVLLLRRWGMVEGDAYEGGD